MNGGCHMAVVFEHVSVVNNASRVSQECHAHLCFVICDKRKEVKVKRHSVPSLLLLQLSMEQTLCQH